MTRQDDEEHELHPLTAAPTPNGVVSSGGFYTPHRFGQIPGHAVDTQIFPSRSQQISSSAQPSLVGQSVEHAAVASSMGRPNGMGAQKAPMRGSQRVNQVPQSASLSQK